VPDPKDIEYATGGTFVIALTGCSENNCKSVSKTVVVEHEGIEFTDKVLEKRIRAVLRKQTGPITKPFAATITKLDLSRPNTDTTNIRNIDALQYFTSLKELNIFGNKVYDLSPLAELTKLEMLNLYNNEVVDLLPIENLTDLENLHLWSNNVEEIKTLSKLGKFIQQWLL
jgi:Leucine-rich repeat (LRR) protein